MGDAPRTSNEHGGSGRAGGASTAHQFESRTLEQRLDALSEQTGVGRAGLVGGVAAVGLAAGVAGAVPIADGFSRAVAARRGSMAAKISAGAVGGAGVLTVVVLMAMRLQTEPPAPPEPAPMRHEEPTFWNLRDGVADPAALDNVAGLNPRGGGAGNAAGDLGGKPAVGVAPSSWPADVRP